MSEAGDGTFWARVNDLFHRAIEATPDARGALLAEVAVDDPELAREVASLLAAHERAGDFIERPAGSAEALLRDVFEQPDPRVGRTIGQYRIERVLGEGGMGVVYQAEDTRLGRTVALKAIPERFTGDAVRRERLRREARAAASLSHPGIATVYALEEFDGQTYLVSEYVPGETLRDELSRGPLDPAAALSAAVDVARALAAAHERGVVHRDLKPENVIRARDGTMKILDFGLAQIDGAEDAGRLTAAGGLLGTPAYMAPEQIRGATVDARADVFAMGALLQEMVTGEPPFRGATPAATMARILESPPERFVRPDPGLTEREANLVRAIGAIAARCLEKSPAARYDNATALAEVLTALRDGPPRSPVDRLVPSRSDVSRDATLWWWQFHQAAASVAYLLLLVPLWIARDWSPGAPGLTMFVAGLAAAVTATTLRLHRWFAVRAYPAEWAHLRADSSTLGRAADSVFVLALLGGGLLVVDAHRILGALLIAAAAGVLVSFAVIEPATTRAAERERV